MIRAFLVIRGFTRQNIQVKPVLHVQKASISKTVVAHLVTTVQHWQTPVRQLQLFALTSPVQQESTSVQVSKVTVYVYVFLVMKIACLIVGLGLFTLIYAGNVQPASTLSGVGFLNARNVGILNTAAPVHQVVQPVL